MNDGVHLEDFLGGAIEEGLCDDSVAIKIVDNDEVFHSVGGNDWESSGLVG